MREKIANNSDPPSDLAEGQGDKPISSARKPCWADVVLHKNSGSGMSFKLVCRDKCARFGLFENSATSRRLIRQSQNMSVWKFYYEKRAYIRMLRVGNTQG